MKNDKPDDLCLDRPLAEIWTQALEILSKSKKIKHGTFASFVRLSQLVELTTTEAVIAVSNDFGRSKVGREHKDEIEAVLKSLIGRPVTVSAQIDPSAIRADDYTPSIASITVMPAAPVTTQTRLPQTQSYDAAVRTANSNIIPTHVFESFVVGSSNRFSHAAALAVAEKPGEAYNPLFLYGGVGLGKTHLLHAIGNAVIQKAPHMVVRYLSCEKFTNEVINAIREQKTPEFRKRYRQVDLLLMDDIQFLEGKESTQEEFFHTFNHLRDHGKQIVLSSDRPPKALAKLAERLRSRFEWGLISDIQAPDYEMRLAILRKKAELENRNVPDFALDYIAKTFTNNMRELEGALLKAHVYANFTGDTLTPGSLAEAFQTGVQKKDRPALTAETIINEVASYFRIETAELRSSKRSRDLTVPRHIAMYLLHELMSLSYPRTGHLVGDRAHTSAMHACDKIKIGIIEDPNIAEAVREITRKLNSQ